MFSKDITISKNVDNKSSNNNVTHNHEVKFGQTDNRLLGRRGKGQNRHQVSATVSIYKGRHFKRWNNLRTRLSGVKYLRLNASPFGLG